MSYQTALTKEQYKLVEEIKEIYVTLDNEQKAKCFGVVLGIVTVVCGKDVTLLKIVKQKTNQIYRGEF